MPTIEQSVEVNVPVSTAYEQWTQFEELPSFMDGVKEVGQVDSHGTTSDAWRGAK
jgi:uncharacterized membrane protein